MPGYLAARKAPIIIPNPTPDVVAAGSKTTFRVPVGATYLESLLKCTDGGVAATAAKVKADIEYIRVTTDAKEKWMLSGAQLFAFDEFFKTGIIADTGWVPLFFRRPWMQTIANQDGPRYGTSDLESMTIEVKLASAADIDGLELHHRQVGASPLGTHQKLISENRPYGSVGTQQIFDLARDPLTRLLGMHIKTDETHVTRIQLKADGFTELDVTVAELKRIYAMESSPRAWQTGFVHLDFCARNLFDDSMPMTMDRLELAITYDAAPGNVLILQDLATPSDTKAAIANASRG